jgi:hypothetical protein
MLTYFLQWAIAAFSFGFAIVALRVWRITAQRAPVYAVPWRMSSLAFLAHAILQTVQYSWGGLAMARPESGGIMAAYLRWAPAMNHGRTFLLLFFSAALSVYAVKGGAKGPRYWIGYSAGLLVAATAGAVMGGFEGPLVALRHYGVVAGWDAVELVVLLCALLVAVTRDRLDRHLWGAMAVYGFSVALSILWFAALTQIDNPATWTPPPWALAGYRAAARAGMLWFALRRLRFAMRDIPVTGMLSDRPRVTSTLAH